VDFNKFSNDHAIEKKYRYWQINNQLRDTPSTLMEALPSAIWLVMPTLLHLGEFRDFCFTGKCPFMYS